MTIVEIARCFLGVREAGQNRGLRVEAIQHWSGGEAGDSWCMEMAWMWLDLFFAQQHEIPRFQSVEAFRAWASTQGYLVDSAAPGRFVIRLDPTGRGEHVGLCTDPGLSIAGNTSADGTSANGDRVAEHALAGGSLTYVAIPGVA